MISPLLAKPNANKWNVQLHITRAQRAHQLKIARSMRVKKLMDHSVSANGITIRPWLRKACVGLTTWSSTRRINTNRLQTALLRWSTSTTTLPSCGQRTTKSRRSGTTSKLGIISISSPSKMRPTELPKRHPSWLLMTSSWMTFSSSDREAFSMKTQSLNRSNMY